MDYVSELILKKMLEPFETCKFDDTFQLPTLNIDNKKENNMNKKEAQEQVKKIRETIARAKEDLERLQVIIEAPEGRWRAEEGGTYWCVTTSGDIEDNEENNDDIDSVLHEKGNYSQTKEKAKASNLYKIINSEYEYYIAGVSDNWDDIPKETTIEYYSKNNCWIECDFNYDYPSIFNYRWKK